MRHLEPSDDIRSGFQSLNLGYFVAGMVAERISGQSWTDSTRARLTDKLHMNVTFTVEDLAAAANAAVPHWMDGDTRLRAERLRIADTLPNSLCGCCCRHSRCAYLGCGRRAPEQTKAN